MGYYGGNDGQQVFNCNYTFSAILVAIKLFFKGIIFFPFLVCGYLAAKIFLHRKDNGLLWLILVLLFAYIIFLIFHFMVQKMNRLKLSGNLIWIPFFLICAFFTCIIPVWIIFEPVGKILQRLTHHSNPIALTWIFSLAFGFYLFFRYPFFRYHK
jgi:hypothetical protein